MREQQWARPAAAQASQDGQKIAIGVINHTATTVEPPALVANLIRKALEFVPPSA